MVSCADADNIFFDQQTSIHLLHVLKSQNMASGVYFYTNEFGDKIEQALRKWKPVERAILKMKAQN